MTQDPHTSTTAAPTPQPTPTVAPAAATATHPVGTAAPAGAAGATELPFGIPPDRPEILVGAAFAGGLLAAIILKRLGGH